MDAVSKERVLDPTKLIMVLLEALVLKGVLRNEEKVELLKLAREDWK